MKIDIQKAKTLLKERISIHLGLRPLVISIDGRAASGKTTFAETLSRDIDITVIKTDDFFRPKDEFGNLNISEYDGNFDIERFKKEVIDGIKSNNDFEYGRFDCKLGKIAEKVKCRKCRCFLIEGSYSQNPKLGDYADIKIFFDIDKQTQKERIISRNGIFAFESFDKIWIPAEERYIRKYEIDLKCDFIVMSSIQGG